MLAAPHGDPLRCRGQKLRDPVIVDGRTSDLQRVWKPVTTLPRSGPLRGAMKVSNVVVGAEFGPQ